MTTDTDTDAEQRDIVRGLAAINDEAAGVYAIDVYGPEDIPGLLLAANSGDAQAVAIFVRLERALDGFAKPISTKHCGSCLAPISGLPRRVALLQAERDDARTTMAFGLCQRCAPDLKAARQAAIRSFRQLAPGARLLDVVPGGGRA